MRRSAVLLSLVALLAACGSEQEKTLSAPAAERSARSAAYDDCEARIAVGSSAGAEISEEALQAYREAVRSNGDDGVCASVVDDLEDAGWTAYAPLSEASAEGTASAWVEAINARDWTGVCELSVVVQDDCEGVVEDMFGPDAGKVRIEGFYRAQDQTAFALSVPEGVEPTVERHDGRYQVHFEYAVIR